MHRLEILHSLGLLHLDIKNENLVLESENMKDPESSFIRLIDFGLSYSFIDHSTKSHI